jgi:hypothetical protein
MDKRLIYGLFETLMVSAVGWVYRLPADTLNRKILQIDFYWKYNFKTKNTHYLRKIILEISKNNFSKNRIIVSAACR